MQVPRPGVSLLLEVQKMTAWAECREQRSEDTQVGARSRKAMIRNFNYVFSHEKELEGFVKDGFIIFVF